MKRAFFVIGPEGSGTYMLAEAFVSAGCTYCDKDDVAEFLKEKQPNLLVLRRSLPHAGKMPNPALTITKLEDSGYKVNTLAIIRDQTSAEISTANRRPTETYIPNETFGYALRVISDAISLWGARFISYEYFILSKNYRKLIFKSYSLPEPQMEFYDGNAKYYE